MQFYKIEDYQDYIDKNFSHISVTPLLTKQQIDQEIFYNAFTNVLFNKDKDLKEILSKKSFQKAFVKLFTKINNLQSSLTPTSTPFVCPDIVLNVCEKIGLLKNIEFSFSEKYEPNTDYIQVHNYGLFHVSKDVKKLGTSKAHILVQYKFYLRNQGEKNSYFVKKTFFVNGKSKIDLEKSFNINT